MKSVILAALLFSMGSTGYANGLIKYACETENAKMTIFHFGMAHTISGIKVAYGDQSLHDPESDFVALGNDIYVDDNSAAGGRRFYLRGLFTNPHAPTYPIPEFEVQVRVFGGEYVVYEKGTCKAISAPPALSNVESSFVAQGVVNWSIDNSYGPAQASSDAQEQAETKANEQCVYKAVRISDWDSKGSSSRGWSGVAVETATFVCP